MSCKGALLNPVVKKKSVEIDFRLRKLMIFTLFFPTKFMGLILHSEACPRFRWGICQNRHPILWGVTDTQFYSSSLGTGQINWLQNLTYSSGKTPDAHQKRSLSLALNPVWRCSASVHILPPAESVCPVSALATAPGKPIRPGVVPQAFSVSQTVTAWHTVKTS